MNFRLEELSVQQYADAVLPLSEPLWGHGRTIEEYRSQTAALAHTAYGRTSYRTLALTDGSDVLASFKRYERTARAESARLRAIGIGAVFTPEHLRGRGFASAMLAMALDAARHEGMDFAYLFSDIHPQFYRAIGFDELPSRSISFRADSLSAARINAQPLQERDWSAVRSCFESAERPREFGLVRSPAVWNWLRKRIDQAMQPEAQPVHLLVRERGRASAYVIGRREPRHDAYVVDEIGVADDRAAGLVGPLLRCAAGDLRRIAGWLPPAPVRAHLPRGSVRRRGEAIWMVAPLSAGGRRFLELASKTGASDGVWKLDHI